MARVELFVPFAEKEQAKRLGARWDVGKKLWYVPEGANLEPFKAWLPKEHHINLRSPSYYIAETRRICWRCGKLIVLFGFLLPAGYEVLEPIEKEEDEFSSLADYQTWLESPASSIWIKQTCPAMAYYLSYLSAPIQTKIQTFTSHYRMNFSQTASHSYGMNHCLYCKAKQGDFELYCEPKGPFYPIDKEDASQITLWPIQEPFEGSGETHDNEFFSFMPQKTPAQNSITSFLKKVLRI